MPKSRYESQSLLITAHTRNFLDLSLVNEDFARPTDAFLGTKKDLF